MIVESMSSTTEIDINLIRTDGGTQPRINQDWKVVDEYAQDMLTGAAFPPVVIFYDDVNYWLADGFHRYHATKQIGRETIAADIRQGSQRAAILFSVGVNAHHGFRRTNADKRAVVEKLLRDEEWVQWSDNQIAKQCGVNQSTVSRIRQENPSYALHKIDPRYVERNGTIYTMNTTAIGLQQIKPPSRQFPDQFYPDPIRDIEYVRDEYPQVPASHSWLDAPLPAPGIEGIYSPVVKSSTLTALQSSESNEWFTPAIYVDVARELMGGEIDLDPASNEYANRTIKANEYYDSNKNGLSRDWYGRVWLNPPYGFTDGESNQSVWSSRLIDQFKNGITTEAVLLVNANTEAKWFQPLYDHLICFTNHRIRFYNVHGESSQPTQGNAFIYFGRQKERFVDLFRQFGVVVGRIK